MMKIISWNVNGIRAAQKKGFAPWLLNCGADVVCIQETKASPSQLDDELLQPKDLSGTQYKSFFNSAKKPGYSGTAIYSKAAPDKIENLGNALFDDEGRVTCAFYGDLAIVSAYFPNSQDGGKRLEYKLSFCDAIFSYCKNLVAQKKNVVLCGDYNIAHKPIDLANPKSNEGNAGFLPEERAWMDKFTQGGFVDTFRHFCQEEKQYTWWSYRFHAREKNVGWRIDYHCVNEEFLPRIKSSKILADVMGSDHCPIELEIEE
ncbi:MAG: exodeoxyribonuclease III [Treponemataceae bacterium]|nr:exodeoxyribonuclease III [Treponemataceae bacterium]